MGKETEGKETDRRKNLLPGDKYCLSVEEAARYIAINDKKIREIGKDHMDDGLVVMHGVKMLIIRPAFEKFLAETPLI